jgi:hypothetical protein
MARMLKWQDFLQGLATRGGAIFVLTTMVLTFGILVFHVLHHSDDPQTTTVILSTFSGFCAALLTMLTTQATKTPSGNTQIETETHVTAQTGDTGK